MMVVPFVGPTYELARKKADTQRVVNMYPDHIESGGGKSNVYLKSISGLKSFSVPIPPIYFWRSLIYPFLVEDSMTYPNAQLTHGFEFIINPDGMSLTNALITGGSLTVTISYKSYTNQQTVNPDSMTYGNASIQSGELTTTINYVSYTNQRDVNPDSMSYSNASIQSGSLTVTIEYIGYTNQRDYAPDTMSYPAASIQSGSLA